MKTHKHVCGHVAEYTDIGYKLAYGMGMLDDPCRSCVRAQHGEKLMRLNANSFAPKAGEHKHKSSWQIKAVRRS